MSALNRSMSPAGGRRALVTGAASGIGLAIARRLWEHEATVVLSDLPGDRLEATAAALPGCLAIGADLSRREGVHQLGDSCGDVDILVNNAGLQHISPVEELDEDRWDVLQAVMLTAPFLLTKRLIGGMYERGWGRVVNIASVHGLIASPYKSAYVSAKHGLIGLTRAVSLEVAARCPDVTVHAICPTYVRTPLVEQQIEAQSRVHGLPREKVLESVLLTQNAVKRLVEPEDVAEAVEFLCGHLAWTMTGAVLTMDAGWLAH